MRDADFIGDTGQAWHVKWPQPQATVGCWIVKGPYHPHWSWWAILAIHLREEEGVPPPYKQYEHATHEFQILSIDPDCVIDVDAWERGEGGFTYLTPPDCVLQFGGVDDDQAAWVVKNAAKMVCMGFSPDSDFRSWWEGTILNQVQLMRTGGIGVPVAQA